MTAKTYLVTGGAGFIGSNYIHYLFEHHPEVDIINLDKLTYAGNLSNLADIEGHIRYRFIKGDISDRNLLNQIFLNNSIDVVVNFAAETHVDRSIIDPLAFIQTDMMGTFQLLECCRQHQIEAFVQISTDEVYGSLETGSADESYPLMSTNPYSASKAGADRLAFSFFKTYDLPVIITRCSNNYGPFQYPEKMIPLFVTHLIEGKKVPLYGDGQNIRDWIYVEDHCRAVQHCIQYGKFGEVYNIAGKNELKNIEIVYKILNIMNLNESSIEYVKDRPGHDRRYSLNDSKLSKLGFKPQMNLDLLLERTVQWYIDFPQWWQPIKSGEFLKYYQQQYVERPLAE